MIGKLIGKIDSIFEDYIILNVNGVGYQVYCSSKILSNLKINEEISFLIQMIVKEDSITLYGFLSNNEKKLFETLCKVNGIGSKMALKIISILTLEEILDAININDPKIFSRVPGIGSKIASRIIIELKGIKKIFNSIEINIENQNISNNINDNRLKDALSALENLGYQKSIAYNVILNILKENEDIVLESLITEALKKINNF